MLKRHKLWVVGFLTLICFPLIADLISRHGSPPLQENRVATSESAKSSVRNQIFLYVRNYDSSFWGRGSLVKLYIHVFRDLFGISPLPQKLVLGKNGWVYLADYGAMDDCRNVYPFSEQQLRKLSESLGNLCRNLKGKNIAMYIMVVPDKHSIYPEHLPDYVTKVHPFSRLDLLSEELKQHTSVRFLNLTDGLIRAKSDAALYYKLESHWNDYGSYVGYHLLLTDMQREFPQIPLLPLSDCNLHDGIELDLDLAVMLGEGREYSETTMRITPRNIESIEAVAPGISIPKSKQHRPDYVIKRVNQRLAAPKLLVFRDSYFVSMVPFIEQSFSEVTCVWSYHVDMSIVDRISPDIVLLEIAERHLDQLSK